jgi:hypothetical protein
MYRGTKLMTLLVDHEPYYTLQQQILDGGEFHDVRGQDGNEITFLTIHQAVHYSKQNSFIEVTKFAKQLRLQKRETVLQNVGESL